MAREMRSVWLERGIDSNHPLLHHDRIVIAPHVASGTRAGRLRIFAPAMAEGARDLSGQDPLHLVNNDVSHSLAQTGSACDGA